MKKKLKNVIREMEYAQKIHDGYLKDPNLLDKIGKNKKIIRQKEEIVKALKGKIRPENEQINLLKKWRRVHFEWVAYFAGSFARPNLSRKHQELLEKNEKEKGGISWHLRWVSVYYWAAYYLKKMMIKMAK